eukprot:763756-Amphidinium_carterae.1
MEGLNPRPCKKTTWDRELFLTKAKAVNYFHQVCIRMEGVSKGQKESTAMQSRNSSKCRS